jgi:hypothetical protein
MPVSHEQAREVARCQTEPGWDFGTFCLDDRTIVENDDLFVFNVGAREYLVDGDRAFALVGGVAVVYKADGRFDTLPSPVIAMDPTIRSHPNPAPILVV